MSCKQDCKIKYCGKVECECNKDEVIPFLKKQQITACPPGYSNEMATQIGVAGPMHGEHTGKPVYVRKCIRYPEYNREDCCFGNTDTYNKCENGYCLGTPNCESYLRQYCLNPSDKYWNDCKDWIYSKDNKTKIDFFNKKCIRRTNVYQPECHAFFNRPNENIFEYFDNSEREGKTFWILLIVFVILIILLLNNLIIPIIF